MNIYDFIVLGVIAVWFIAAAVITVKRKKRGACCGCSGCSGCKNTCKNRKRIFKKR